MNNKDLHGTVKVLNAIYPILIGANATKAGKIIDRKGYGGVEFIAHYGAVTTTGSVLTVVVKEGDATGSLTSVADSNLLGTEALASLLATTPRTSGSTMNVAKRIGYRGNKRYVQLSIVQTGTTSAGMVGVAAVLFNPEAAPVSNP